MSETIKQQVNEFDGIANSLSIWNMEPLITDTIEEIKEYNQLLSDEPQNQDQINEIMNAIDSRWAGLKGKHCKFTGMATFVDIWREGMPRILSDYEEEGFIFRGVKPVQVGREPLDEDDPVLYKLKILLCAEEIDPEGRPALSDGYCDIDQIVNLEFDEFMSLERAVVILRTLHPRLLDKIDRALLNPDSDSPDTNRMIRLSGLSLSPEKIDDHRTMALLRKSLNLYTNTIIVVDGDIPHTLEVDGEIFVMSSEKVLTVKEPMMAIVDCIAWRENPADDDNCLIPHLMSRLCLPDSQDVMPEIMIPLESVSELESIRYKYFDNDDVTDSSVIEYNI